MQTATVHHYEVSAPDSFGVPIVLLTTNHIEQANDYVRVNRLAKFRLAAVYSDGSTNNIS